MERKIMKMVDHPNIVKLVDNFEDRNNIYLVMEICHYKSLRDYLNLRGKLHEHEAKYFFR